MASPFPKQITNRNFLSPIGFKFSLAKYPKIDFFSNEASIPAINLGVAVQPTYLKDIPIPGDKLSYDDFTLRFLVDENLENYLLVHRWLRAFGYPQSVYEFQELLNEDELSNGYLNAISGQSNGTLIVYGSSNRPVLDVTFSGLFPVSLSTLNFDAKLTDTSYLTAEVTFKYTIYDVKEIK